MPPELLTVRVASVLIRRYSESEYFIVSDSILSFGTTVACISLNGVDFPVLNFLNDTDMICQSVLRTGRTSVVPVEEDNITGIWRVGIILPFASVLEPLNAVATSCKLGDDTHINISGLIGTPTDETSTPFYTGAEAVPSPIWFAADIADLRLCYSDNGIVTG